VQLRRITSSGKWFPEIDGLRFIAIFSVIFVHIYAEMVWSNHAHAINAYPRILIDHGTLTGNIFHLNRGVQLFFVISGLILAQPFVNQFVRGGPPVSVKAYYLRRVTRLEPPYLLSLALFGAVIAISQGLTRSHVLSLLASSIYIHNFLADKLPVINGPLWSLEVEIEFYLLVPLLARVFTIQSARLRRGLLAAAILVGSLIPVAAADGAGFYLPGSISYFLIGFLLADLRLHDHTIGTPIVWDALALISGIALIFVDDGAIRTLPCLLMLAFVAASLSGPLIRRALRFGWIPIIGGMCYSIYLTHMLVIAAGYRVTAKLLTHRLLIDYLIQALLLIPPVLLVGLCYYILIEHPCMDPKWPQKLVTFLRQRIAPATVSASVSEK
jgi:peptidoglycan/LPS O-acetylase OafA/YrhL